MPLRVKGVVWEGQESNLDFSTVVFLVTVMLVAHALVRWYRRQNGGTRTRGRAKKPASAGKLMRAATTASVVVATSLIVVKIVAWVLTGSVSLLSSLVDSILDVMASMVNFLAVRRALRPADADYRFGHGKAEPLAGLGQSAFITGSAMILIFEAGERIIDPVPIQQPMVGISVMVLSIVLTVGLVLFQRYVVRTTGSTAIGADALHYETDALINGSVIVSLGLSSYLGWQLADPIFALAIASYLLLGAWRIARRAVELLMDREFSNGEREKIYNIVLQHPKAKGIHELRTRRSGLQPFIQFHLELDGRLSLNLAHKVTDEVETSVKKAFPCAEIIIHQDPFGLVENHPAYSRVDPRSPKQGGKIR